MQEWVEIREQANTHLSELTEKLRKINDEIKSLHVLKKKNEISEEDNFKFVDLRERFSMISREVWIVRGQISVMSKILNYDYPFEIGKAYSVEHREINNFF